jgi:hypothetical protein
LAAPDKPPEEKAATTDKPSDRPPLVLRVEPVKSIYRLREGVTLQFTLTAQEPVRLCLEKDPLTQFQFQVTRGGKGQIPLEPLVVNDNRELYFEKMRIIDLKPGQTFPYRANLKRLNPAKGEKWLAGDYSVQTTFNLCDQKAGLTFDSSGRETPIKAQGVGRFLIVD